MCSIEARIVKRSNCMSVKSVKFIPFTLTLILLSACGSSSSNDTPIANDLNAGVVSDNSDVVVPDNSGVVADNSGVVADNSDAMVGTESVSSDNMVMSSVCAGIAGEVTYEIYSSNAAAEGLYVPSLAPGILGWDGTDYCDLTSSQAVEKIDLLIPYSSSTPQLDGEFELSGEEWAQAAVATWSIAATDVNIIRNLITGADSGYIDGARTADWAAMHDGTYLYINVFVRNDGLSQAGNIQTFLDSEDPRNDDSIDIFIDGDNSKGTQYDGTNDYHVTLAHLDRTWSPEIGSNSTPGLDVSFRTNVPANEEFQLITYEIKINLSSAGIEVGVPFGFDIQLNEDDNGGPADARFAWHEPTGSALADSNPSVFGTIVLTGCSDADNCNFTQSLNGR